MCLGTFSRLARSLATVYIFARVCIFGTSVSFYVTGNSAQVQKNIPGLPQTGDVFYLISFLETDHANQR